MSWTVSGSGLWWEVSVECILTRGQKNPCLVVFLLAMERNSLYQLVRGNLEIGGWGMGVGCGRAEKKFLNKVGI